MEERQIPKVKANKSKDVVIVSLTLVSLLALTVFVFNLDNVIGAIGLVIAALLLIPIRKIQFWEYKGIFGDGAEKLNEYLDSKSLLAKVRLIDYERNGYKAGYPHVTLTCFINDKEDILFGWWIIDHETQETRVLIEYDKCDFTCEDVCGHDVEYMYADVTELVDKKYF